MKFVRWGTLGEEKPGILDSQGCLRDLSGFLPDITPKRLTASLCTQLEAMELTELPSVDEASRIGSCIGPIGKIICIGFNSQAHVRELGLSKPKKRTEPIMFMKPTSALSGSHDPIWYTRHTQKLDWEAELALIIGRKGKYIPLEESRQYIFGYACFNDLTERYLQFETEDSQFTKGKCFDNSATLGPYLVTKDEIIDSGNLSIKLWVNGTIRQDFNSSDYIFNEAQVIHFASQYFTLYPGDVISMGSGPGSAAAWGNQFLQPGDQIVLQIEGLGEQRQTIVAES
jgi:2-keto-4-pentenoate hydratase/2-oxohepta-3-ene-1,7-dioic acid hydratase in catechol pathway